MIIGIDAANLRSGGGVTHLVELLRVANPNAYGFKKVIVWGGTSTLDKIENRPWLKKSAQSMLNKKVVFRIWWQYFQLIKLARAEKCDLLFIPGGICLRKKIPFVVMSQNLLPFELGEAKRYGLSKSFFRLVMLRIIQTKTFREARGTIFLTNYAKDITLMVTGKLCSETIVIAHGVNDRFRIEPRVAIENFSDENPCRIIYVSSIEEYKHHEEIVEAVASLRKEGVPVDLDLVGGGSTQAVHRLGEILERFDPQKEFIRYSGEIDHVVLHEKYKNADIKMFGSSCETFGQILTEAMAAGLPIACSKRSCMPEILGDAGVYFDPECSSDIAKVLLDLINSLKKRQSLALAAYESSKQYTWRKCAHETFSFFQSTLAVKIRSQC